VFLDGVEEEVEMNATYSPAGDPAHDVLQYERQPLQAIFNPRSVAVVGATEKEGSVGRTILWNLISNPFGATVFPVNPKRPSILGIKAYSSISDIPTTLDLAVIVVPAPGVPAVIHECVERGVKGAIIISAGFKDIGEQGALLEQQILKEARRGKMRIIGPNCLGVMSPVTGLNATFASAMARHGNVGFISQSGALCTAVLDWSLRENVGFSSFISIGSMLDVGWGDLIYYLGDDPHTKSIVIYMETVGNARAFLSAAREVAFTKPIIIIKAGRTEAAAKAAASHTGSLAGSDDVLDAAFRRCGVLRVNRIAELFYMAEILDKQPRPKGPNLTIVTNAGGPAVLTCDALIQAGGKLAELDDETMALLNKLLPPHWSHNNPIDILGDAGPERYAEAVTIVSKNPHSDGMLVSLTPQAMTDPTQTAEQLKKVVQKMDKPVLASWMGGNDVKAGIDILTRAGIPNFPYSDTAAQVFTFMWRYTYNQRGLYETPTLLGDSDQDKIDRHLVAGIIERNLRQPGQNVLSELESKQILSAYGIPTTRMVVAMSPQEAIAAAKEIGYPVVLKLHSETITHKTDVGGVKLNLGDDAAVSRAYQAIEKSVAEKAGKEHFAGVSVQPMIRKNGYELILGSSLDPQFGPVILFGAGGQLVELFKDKALGLPPLNSTLARRMMEQTIIFKALQGVRGRKPVDLEALEFMVVRFSQLVVEHPLIREIDINPLVASPDGCLALDARVILHGVDADLSKLPELAIRPYPRHYVSTWTLKNGTPVVLRPIRPEDEPLLVKFHEGLSDRSVYFRYMEALKLTKRIAHERLSRMCFINYDREMAFVAERTADDGALPEILGVARMIKEHATNDAEFSMIISDQWQNQGLGAQFLKKLIQVAKDEKLDNLHSEIVSENEHMKRLCGNLGFSMRPSEGENLIAVEYKL
jgi:acetyltransferase